MITKQRQVQSGMLVPRWVVVVPVTLLLVGATVVSWESGGPSQRLAFQPVDCCEGGRPPTPPEAHDVSSVRRSGPFRTGPKQARSAEHHLRFVPQPPDSVLPPPVSAEAPLALAVSAMPSGPAVTPPAAEPEPMEEFLTAMEMGEVEQ